jgi:ABC-type sugar transport system substrate-binding protein
MRAVFRKSVGALLAPLLVTSLALAGCGSDGDSGNDQASRGVQNGAPAALDGHGKLVVIFMLSGISPFLTDWQKSVVQRLDDLNFKTKVITNERDPAQEDQQVQQYLATGEKPAAFIWWPASSAAGVNSTKLLSKVAPVIQTNQAVTPEGKDFIALYAGVDDVVNGQVSGQILLNARDADVAAGRQLHSPEGNIVMFNGPDGYQGSIDRLAGFTDVTSSKPFNEVASSANANADDGYKNATALLPKLKAEGVDYLWSFNQSIASGAIKALQQNGIIPGKDITVVDGSCSIGSETYSSGESYGTVLQSAVLEARVVADSVARYLANGKKAEPGDEQLENAAEMPDTPTTAPHERVIIPMPPLEGKEAVATEKVWGLTVPVLCAQ